MIERTILHIFNEGGKRVILPSFGALIKRGSGEIAFTDMLTEDDGILIAECAQLYDKSKEVVRREIESYILSLRENLTSSNKAEIAGIGTITKTPTGIYALTSENIPEHEFSGTDTIERDAESVFTEKAIEQEQESVESSMTIPEELTSESIDTDASTATAIYTEEADNDFTPEEHPDTEEQSTPAVFHNRSKKAILRSALYGNDTDSVIETEVKVASADEVTALRHETKEAIVAAEEHVLYGNSEAPEKNDLTSNNTDIPKDVISAEQNIETESTTTETTKVTEIYSQGQSVARDAKQAEKPYTPEFNIRRPNTGKKKRVDGVMVIAIIALIIIIGVIVYGQLVEREVYSQDAPIILNMEESGD